MEQQIIYEKDEQRPVINIQGIPIWGYCPNCGETITKTGCPIGCKWCLQKLDWGINNDSNN